MCCAFWRPPPPASIQVVLYRQVPDSLLKCRFYCWAVYCVPFSQVVLYMSLMQFVFQTDFYWSIILEHIARTITSVKQLTLLPTPSHTSCCAYRVCSVSVLRQFTLQTRRSTYLNTLAFSAQPTKPWGWRGSCKNLISSGAIPSGPRLMVCSRRCSFHENTFSDRPYTSVTRAPIYRMFLLSFLGARKLYRTLTFRHRASCILGQAFRYSPENTFYIFNQQIYFIIWYLLDRASLI